MRQLSKTEARSIALGRAPASGAASNLRFSTLLAIALRDFRGGLGGFTVFLCAIALGVAAITGVGSVARSLANGLAGEGRVILGGDVSFRLAHREPTVAERGFLERQGRMSEIALMRAMARRADGEAALIEVKAVDQFYPLAGSVALEPAMPLAEALAATHDGAFGLVIDAALAAKLELKPGDRIEIGAARFAVKAILANEPDQLAGGIAFGARVILSARALRATQLLGPGSLIRWYYRIAIGPEDLSSAARDARIEDLIAKAKVDFPEAGWEIRTHKNVSPQFSRNLDRFTQFLTLVGLTSLVVGGVGVANAIQAYVLRKTPTIAILKALGATGSTVFALMLLHVMFVALLGALLGAAIGTALPFAAAEGFGALLPFPMAPAIHAGAIGQGLLFGLLTALAFSLWPLGRVHDIPVQALFREEIEPASTLPRRRYLVLTGAVILALAGSAFAFSSDSRLTFIYAGATLAAFALLRGFAFIIMRGAARLPRPRKVALRLAIGNIHRPGALTPSVVLALGLGIALVVALTMIERNIRGELSSGYPGETPSFFFIDIQKSEAERFTDFLRKEAPNGHIELVPMLRGRIVALNGLGAEAARPKQNAAWALHGDRGVTFAETLPEGSTLEDGAWWPKDYDGLPLVSLEAEIANGLGLAIGDEIIVNVLGRNITARIANTRKVNWRTFGINFVLVFSPNTFAAAPYGDLATLTFPKGGDPAGEVALLRETARSFPAVTTIRVKDALEAVNTALGQLAVAVRVASGVTVLSAILVLGGALAAGQQARLRDAVVLKTLGATRPRLVAAFLYEFVLIGLMTAILAVAAGGAAAGAIVRHVMDFHFVWLWPPALIAVAAALGVTIALGLIGTWHILGREPAPYLRDS